MPKLVSILFPSGALTHSVKGLDMSFKAAGSDKLVIK